MTPVPFARRVAGEWLPLVAWMATIYWLSDQPDLPHAPDAVVDFLVKKTMHAAGYGVLAVLWWRALCGVGVLVRVPARHLSAWAIVLTAVYAAGDEWHQTFVPGRTGRASDVVIDLVGGLVGLGVVRVLARFSRSTTIRAGGAR